MYINIFSYIKRLFTWFLITISTLLLLLTINHNKLYYNLLYFLVKSPILL